MATINLNFDGKKQTVDVDPKTPVLWVLRDHLNLVGTKFGCGIAQCGACTIHVDGAATRSCVLPVSSVENREIVTIEGLSENGDHPVQKPGWNMMSPNADIARPDRSWRPQRFWRATRIPMMMRSRTP